jgi:hypothetical protein
MTEDEKDPEISVEVELTLTGWVSVRMKLSEARALGEKVDGGRVDADDVPGIDWGDAVNLLDGSVEDINFDDIDDES